MVGGRDTEMIATLRPWSDRGIERRDRNVAVGVVAGQNAVHDRVNVVAFGHQLA
jgi:hypothetical protein